MAGSAFATRAVHVGQNPDPATAAVIPPISLSTTFKQTRPGVHTVGRAVHGVLRILSACSRL